jgi:hypothetical protein
MIVALGVAMTVMTGYASWSILTIRATRQALYREQALMLAEAGVEYYRWHLAHSPDDFQDGAGAAGPYTHGYHDRYGNLVGTFTLDIAPPGIGSTIVTVKSTGTPAVTPRTDRSVEVKLGKPSWAKFAVVADSVMRFGEGTEIYGPVHSNDGIRFDGLAHNLTSSSKDKYDDPDHGGDDEFGVHTHLAPVDPLPPSAVPARTDVFEAGRAFPVPSVDFTGISADLAQMKSDAQDDGRYFGSSGSLGYEIVFKTDDTFDLYRVTSLVNPPSGCSDGQDYWGTWSVNNRTFLNNYGNPANGIVFLEDNTWVRGQISTARVTVAVAKFPESPSTYRHITVNQDLLYTNYDGSDALALIAQGNINAGMVSEDDLRIDAAVLAQNGRVGRHYYGSSCNPYNHRDAITLYGMIGTNERYGFAYTDDTGYDIRELIYDGHFLYAPPPAFPPTADAYQIISWKEVRP